MLHRPHVTSSIALSLDGHSDDRSPERLLLSNETDFAAVDALRAENDAILVGANTLRKDNPRLILRSEEFRARRKQEGKSGDPTKVTVFSSGSLDPSLKFFHTGECEKLVFCPEPMIKKFKAQIPSSTVVIGFSGGAIDPQELLKELYKRNIQRLLIEGGTQIHSEFLQAGLVDELRVAIAPFFVGDTQAPRFILSGEYPFNKTRRIKLNEVEKIGDMAILKYQLGAVTK